jgi:hypothetical protein
MSAWSHLPNAAHIDRVIESSNSYPEVWNVAYDSAWDAAYDSAYTAARNAARNAAYDSAYTAARNAAWNAFRGGAWNAARNAVLAFIAYDDAANYLAMPSDQLKAWAILSENPAAILLLPVVIAYERISEWELA